MNVILFNAPPNTGKDVLCRYMCENDILDSTEFTFKDEMLRLMYNMLGFDYEEDFERFISRENKDSDGYRVMGMNYREAAKWISEDVYKPKFGSDYFVKKTIDEVHNTTVWSSGASTAIISDLGFNEEFDAVLEYCKKFNHNLILVRIFREGCSFESDSRYLVDYYPAMSYNKFSLIDINNNYRSEQEYKEKASQIIKETVCNNY